MLMLRGMVPVSLLPVSLRDTPPTAATTRVVSQTERWHASIRLFVVVGTTSSRTGASGKPAVLAARDAQVRCSGWAGRGAHGSQQSSW